MQKLSESWRIRDNVKNEYIQEISQAAQTELFFQNFKQGTQMRTVVENTPCDQGRIELTEIVNVYPAFLQTYEINEILRFEKTGNPMTCVYPELKFPISPSTIRFIHQTAKIHKYFGTLDGFDIAEIGAGYGGLATIINTYFDPRYYILFDLPEALNLQKKYILNCTPRIEALLQDNGTKLDLLIASCSWSELTTELKTEYVNTIFKRSARGFLIVNWDFDENFQLLKTLMPLYNIWIPEPWIILFQSK